MCTQSGCFLSWINLTVCSFQKTPLKLFLYFIFDLPLFSTSFYNLNYIDLWSKIYLIGVCVLFYVRDKRRVFDSREFHIHMDNRILARKY